MAEQGRTVGVSGLPTDIEDDRLKDKLCIYFLRAKNGGGEVECVSVVKATAGSALITFEQREVAQRVVQQSPHILELDGKMYRLIVTNHHENLDPDKVILSLLAVVSYSQLTDGILAVKSFHRRNPDVQINCDAEEYCTLRGTYSKVQAALAHLLGLAGGPESADNDSGQPVPSSPTGSRSVQTAKRSHTRWSENQSRILDKQRDQSERVHTGSISDENNSSSHRDPTPSGYGREVTFQTEDADLQPPGHPTTSQEEFSLIVDADMFQYLQKHCWREYLHILSQYGVEVVDMTNQGVTTLFLKVTTGVREGGHEQERLELARKAISRLYQENETKIRRSQLQKSMLSPRGGLQRAIKCLNIRLPKLLLNEDDINIYIIGSSSDVSEAKQFLLLDQDKAGAKIEDAASLPRLDRSYDSIPIAPTDEVRAGTMFSTEGSQDDGLDQLLRPEEDERRIDGARRYKLAAKFKDSGLAALSSRPTDLTLRGFSSPSRQTRTGPMLGYDVLSETPGTSAERVSRAESKNTEEDILFKSGDVSHSFMQNKTPLNSNLMDTRHKNLTAPMSATQVSLSESTALPTAESGSTLKRASSFSGTPQQRAHVVSQKSHDDSSKSTVSARGRSSSFSTQSGRDTWDVCKAEITVSLVMWEYLKEAYRTQVDHLTSDVQIKESHPDGRSEVTVTLSGTNQSRVSSCQLGLQKMVESVSVDFSLRELLLTELGVTDRADETLQACCAEVRSRFKKVSVQVLKSSIFLLGPKQLCAKVAAALLEIFAGDLLQTTRQQDLSGISTSKRNPPPSFQMNEEQSTILHCYSSSQVTPESRADKVEGFDAGQERRTKTKSVYGETELVNGPDSQPLVRKDPVIKEKWKIISTLEVDGQRTGTLSNNSSAENERHLRRVNGVGSATGRTDKAAAAHKRERSTQSAQTDSIQHRRAEIRDIPPNSGQTDPGYICVCGDSGPSVTRTKCGTTMCPKCLDAVHVNCKACHETDRTARGIQGKMSHSKLPISLPGHNKDSAIKVTYCIPDGIQGKDHPSPGNPFKGGVFEAFLPDCEKTRKLLPRLEKAFRHGLTFSMTGKETGARVNWDCIPHKTSLQGGKSGNGYPDSTYLTRLSQVLALNGIEEQPAQSQE